MQTQVRPTFQDYIVLTKPRIIELLLVTTVPTMMFAAGGIPEIGVAIATLVGGALAAAGANVLNCFVDSDIDALMPRTAHRATASGRISKRKTLIYGLSLSMISIIVLDAFANTLAAALAAGAIVFYVGVYSLLLKRRTSQNIVWGGIAGCFPVLIGWSAITGSLSWEPFALFLIVFFWTPPHYWPLSIKYKDQYAAADVPMLPVVASNKEVSQAIIQYSWVMVATSLTLILSLGILYAVVSISVGAWFLLLTYKLEKVIDDEEHFERIAMTVFHASITYLSVIFFAVGVASFVA
ncbi:MAG: heme o synthase [Candidatus Nanopelagicales bacterium]